VAVTAVTTEGTATTLPKVDREKTKAFRKELMRSERYNRFGKAQMSKAVKQLQKVSGSELMTRLRTNDFRLTIGDVTFVLAESYGFCWGVERSIAMAYEARNYFPNNRIWATNEIIHNQLVNANLKDMGINFIKKSPDGTKDFSGIQEGDVVILPAFGATVDEMAFLKERNAQIVDTTCPWVSKVWNSVEKNKDKGHTNIVHGKYDHEETMATQSFASKFVVVKDLKEAEYVADYILGKGNREEFMEKFKNAMPEDFDPDKDFERVGVANQTTMLKGETELIGKLFERVMIKKHGPQEINKHFMAFNTICDATTERQGAMYKMLGAEYEPPTSKLLNNLEGEQAGVELMSAKTQNALSSKQMESEMKGGPSGIKEEAPPPMPDLCLIVGGFNSSNTIHLLEIVEEEGLPGYHVDCADRINGNTIEYKPLATHPAKAMRDEGLGTKEGFLPDGPVVVGVSSGASTPDAVVGECLAKILELRGLA
jgi:4-hydroxy-3-methylbut-2-enyl diphosphate reductase